MHFKLGRHAKDKREYGDASLIENDRRKNVVTQNLRQMAWIVQNLDKILLPKLSKEAIRKFYSLFDPPERMAIIYHSHKTMS